MRLATWNINSVRLRQKIVVKSLQELDLDVLALQETKTEDQYFPHSIFNEAGYEHIAITGEKSYNGVAIISRIPFEKTESINFTDGSKRHISANFANGIELHNFYIPAGGDEPDPEINPKFKHKLDFLDNMTDFFTNKRKMSDKLILLGDFNIAPYEHDVWSHKQLLKVVSHTPIEVEKLNKLKSTLDFTDIARNFIPETEKLYSWWSYRNRDWRKSNRGRRLDHIWTSKNIAESVSTFDIMNNYRDLEKPSDHVPVVVDMKTK